MTGRMEANVTGAGASRRLLARALSEQASASAQRLAASPPKLSGNAYRIGITGPPGVGKSSMIGKLAALRLERAKQIGVLAIDPTSPVSGGSLLGDRVRMDNVADNSGLFIRSLPSRQYMDGLCPNILGLLSSFDEAGFDEMILETVGVGQINYAGRYLVDSFVLVLAPESGDTVQAMKGGILETADIYVVNKADLPASERLGAELRSMAAWRGERDGWAPPVVLVSSIDGRGLDILDATIDRYRVTTQGAARSAFLNGKRREYLLRALVQHRFDEVLAQHATSLEKMSVTAANAHILKLLGASVEATT